MDNIHPANKARIFTSSAHVNLVENWCKEYFRVLSVYFSRQLLVFTEKHILVIFNIYIIFSLFLYLTSTITFVWMILMIYDQCNFLVKRSVKTGSVTISV